MKPKISVIVPIYGTEKYLRKCLDSIVNQTMRDIEIICVDDCSPDLSHEIVQEYCLSDKRVKLIRHKENTGQGGARNTAIKASSADFIASVDSDDSMNVTMLEELWKASDNGDFDIVCCGYTKVAENGKIIGDRIYQAEIVDNSDHEINIFTFLNPAIWNKLWRKSLFIDNDIFFPNKLYFQDMATIPLLVACAEKIKVIDKSLYNYLIREGSVTNSYSPKHIIDYYKVYEILYENLKKKGMIEYYAQDLALNINSGMSFHGSNVIESDMDETDKQQYLRHLLMMKWAFVESHDILTTKTEDELLSYLSSSMSIRDLGIGHEESLIFGTIPPALKSPNAFQRIGISVFAFVFAFFINDKQMFKLKLKPHAFFKDSKNPFARIVGGLLKLL